MGHSVDGFDLKYTSRTSWKAERRERGKLIDIVPVTWTDAQHRQAGEIIQVVYYQKPDELELARLNPVPFVIALAAPKHPTARPREFDEFRGVFEVVATGRALDDESIETRVIRRLRAGEST
jgi:hypothetical protein